MYVKIQDDELVAGVEQSMEEARMKNGKVVKTDKEMDDHFEAIENETEELDRP